METKIKLIDRITLGSIFPEKGNVKELIIRGDIRKKIELTQSELEKY